MKPVVGVVAGIALLVTVSTAAQGATTTPPTRGRLSWTPCPAKGDFRAADGPIEDCATVRVPLDHAQPYGQQVTIALKRISHPKRTRRAHLGALLVNPGGPGASGTDLAGFVASALPRDLAERYDIIGFDPRGVGASRPIVSCVNVSAYYAPPRPDHVPRSRSDEYRNLARAREYAQGCQNRAGWLLPYLNTVNAARDLDGIRDALGQDKISFLGYSYGTYLGAVYATLFPQRVRRLILDSVVDPTQVWYAANINQDYAFDTRHKDFLAWITRNHDVFRLGRTRSEVEFAWYAMRQRLRAEPAQNQVGPSELDDIYTVAGYSDAVWPQLAKVFSDYVTKSETEGLIAAYKQHAAMDAAEENGYGIYLAVQCRDSLWPRAWTRWHVDTVKVYRKAPFLAWSNAWYNAPCAFWPVAGRRPARIGAPGLPPILLLQGERDAATPYGGALRMRRLLPSARLVVEPGGNHGVGLAGNRCMDRYIIDYLRDGRLPAARGAIDARCARLPEPRPSARMAAGPGVRHLELTRLIRGR